MRISRSSQSTRHNSHWVFLFLSFLLIGWIGGWSRLIRRGNEHYQVGAYDAAREAYQAAVKKRPERATSHYNLGTALYQQTEFDKAAHEFRRALDVKDLIRRAQGYYNLGNAQVQLDDLAGAIQSYKSALRLNPTDQDTKYNLEFALEKSIQQQLQQPKQSDSGDDRSDQQEQNQRNEKTQEKEQQNGQKTDRQRRQNKPPPEQELHSQSEKFAIQPPEGMSKEDAIRLLKALKDNEKEIQKKILRRRFARRQRPEKDW